MTRIVRIAGEGIDADLVEEPGEFVDPHYPECPVCEQETSNDAGWCISCEAYAHEHRQITMEQWTKVHGDPLLKRRAA